MTESNIFLAPCTTLKITTGWVYYFVNLLCKDLKLGPRRARGKKNIFGFLKFLTTPHMRRLLLILAIGFASTSVFAQGVTTSVISGTVTGASTATNAETRTTSETGLPGANIVATHVPSGTTYGTVSLSDGRFTMPGLRVGGPYKVTVSFIGYETQEKNDI